MIIVDHPDALMDVPVSIEVRDFPATQHVTITAAQEFPSGSRWLGRAVFMADDFGRVRVAQCADEAYEVLLLIARQVGPDGGIDQDSSERVQFLHLIVFGSTTESLLKKKGELIREYGLFADPVLKLSQIRG